MNSVGNIKNEAIETHVIDARVAMVSSYKNDADIQEIAHRFRGKWARGEFC